MEAIRESNFREKYHPRLNLTPYKVTRDTKDLETNLKNAHDFAYQYFLTHPDLSIQALLQKIETQIAIFSNPATAHLVNDTLNGYKESLLATPNAAHQWSDT